MGLTAKTGSDVTGWQELSSVQALQIFDLQGARSDNTSFRFDIVSSKMKKESCRQQTHQYCYSKTRLQSGKDRKRTRDQFVVAEADTCILPPVSVAWRDSRTRLSCSAPGQANNTRTQQFKGQATDGANVPGNCYRIKLNESILEFD